MAQPDIDMTEHCDISFITIHDLSSEARILYSSDSIIDVLGYTPDELVNRSCWDFFPPEEVPFAQSVHERGVELDRAACLAYCRVKDKRGEWVGCECCFTIVYDVVVVCTSIYKSTISSQKRAVNAPIIRKLFDSSPKDPRYHMIAHISPKLHQPYNKDMAHEPRAALFLNRFTRTLTIMYATNALEDLLGVSADDLRGTSFYYCIAENCLQDAIRCLENAKANDSIAYLRFWYRYPLEDGAASSRNLAHDGMAMPRDEFTSSTDSPRNSGSSGASSRTDGAVSRGAHDGMTGDSERELSTPSSASPGPGLSRRPTLTETTEPIELEAVISCASDGLVVCLRKARPITPRSPTDSERARHSNGLFAAPWAEEPLVPPMECRPSHGASMTTSTASQHCQANQNAAPPAGPEVNDYMTAIKEEAVFAWALAGINGATQHASRGVPFGESVPPHGLPIWRDDVTAKVAGHRSDSASGAVDGDMQGSEEQYPGPSTTVFGDPGLEKRRQSPGTPKAKD